MRLSFAASHTPSGKCIFSFLKMTDLEKQDEKKAEIITKKRNEQEL
jgi:hypothetical protein